MAVRLQRTRVEEMRRAGFSEDLRHRGGDLVGRGGSDGSYGGQTDNEAESVVPTRELDEGMASEDAAIEQQWHSRLLASARSASAVAASLFLPGPSDPQWRRSKHSSKAAAATAGAAAAEAGAASTVAVTAAAAIRPWAFHPMGLHRQAGGGFASLTARSKGVGITVGRHKLGEDEEEEVQGVGVGVEEGGGASLRSREWESNTGSSSDGVEDGSAGRGREGLGGARQQASELGGIRKLRSSRVRVMQGTSMSGNALAGGLAGAVVSVCIHPIDTIKTIVQSQRGASQSMGSAVMSVVSKKGVAGLYSGVAASLATSAPISAIYTSTYEAVKERLLPQFPVRFAPVAHCLAGAAASIATSAVFTPSEVVKQRMQITTAYRNSLEALVGIARSEGILSLYAGLGAVLCRNIPNSVIKFITYESLKARALKAQGKDATRMTTVNQLLVGAVAGATAAFCTTPFDVIKTRLQTQLSDAPRYTSVLNAFLSIVRDEGPAALYRGVVPRLLIYLSQGAIFFMSYELLRHVLHPPHLLNPHITPLPQLASPLLSSGNNVSERRGALSAGMKGS